MKTGINPNSFGEGIAGFVHRCGRYLKGNARTMPWLFPGLLIWYSFTKLPVTATTDQPPQSWESVVPYAVSHHFQWGRDIVFTYGPLASLTLDYYWGHYFWLILLWSFGFSLLVTILLMRIWKRITLPIRVALCIALPCLTIPNCSDLGIDPVYLFGITLIGISALPEEQPGLPLLAIVGAALGCFGLIKFTFCLYCLFVLLVVVVAHLLRRRWIAPGIIIGSLVVSFLTAWLLAGQHFSNIWPWFKHSDQIASGYSSAMAITPPDSEQVLGVLIILCFLGLLLIHWFSAKKPLALIPNICILAAGIFLAWKEGFVRADIHIMVFVLYAFFAAATMPALLRVSWGGNRLFLPLTVATMIFSLAPFALQGSGFLAAAKAGAASRLTDTATAVFMPFRFKTRLEAYLQFMRNFTQLPHISAIVGTATVGGLNYDQDVVILNKFNYRPQPVYQDYSAYTPELQRMNSAFFDSTAAPEYVLWLYETIDGRFPTLDEGRTILILLSNYSPVATEGKYVLWKRNATRGRGFSLAGLNEISGSSDQWVPIPAEATWLRIELHETWFGHLKTFLCRGSIADFDIRLADGWAINYTLPTGEASAGFIINPLLRSDADLKVPFSQKGKPECVTAAMIHLDRRCFDGSVLFEMQKIEGTPALRCQPDTH
jgi:hypothetical protein